MSTDGSPSSRLLPPTVHLGAVETLRRSQRAHDVLNRLAASNSLLARHLPAALSALVPHDHMLPQRLMEVIQSGMACPESNIGIYATDAACYHELSALFSPIISDYHGVELKGPWSGDMDSAGLKLPEIVPGVSSSRVRCARNISGFPFPATINVGQRKALEHLIVDALRSLGETEFAGTYHSLETMSRATHRALIREHWLSEPSDRYLLSAGIYRDFPSGRGIFLSANGHFAVIVNEEDALRIVAKQGDGKLRQLCERFFTFAQLLGQRLDFVCDEQFGYLASCPSNIGTALRASVHIRLPLLEHGELRRFARQLGLQVRGQYGEQDSLDPRRPYDISNRRRLGATEVELVNDLFQGIERLIAYHKGPCNA